MKKHLSLCRIRGDPFSLQPPKKSLPRNLTQRTFIKHHRKFKIVSINQKNSSPNQFLNQFRHQRQRLLQQNLQNIQKRTLDQQQRQPTANLKQQIKMKQMQLFACLKQLQNSKSCNKQKPKAQSISANVPKISTFKTGKTTIRVINPWRNQPCPLERPFQASQSNISQIAESFISGVASAGLQAD